MGGEGPAPHDGDRGLGKTAQSLQAVAPYLSAVWKLIGGAAVGVLGGYFMDKHWGTKPWGTVGLSSVGIAVGFYAFIREMLRLGKK